MAPSYMIWLICKKILMTYLPCKSQVTSLEVIRRLKQNCLSWLGAEVSCTHLKKASCPVELSVSPVFIIYFPISFWSLHVLLCIQNPRVYNYNDVYLMARGKVQRSVACANAQTAIVHLRNAQTDSDCSCRRLATSLLNSIKQ